MPSYVHVGAHAVGTAAHNIGPGERVDLDADEAEPWPSSASSSSSTRPSQPAEPQRPLPPVLRSRPRSNP